jgi:membrane-associated protein
MIPVRQTRHARLARVTVLALLAWLAMALMAAAAQPAIAGEPVEGEKPSFFLQVMQNLFNSKALMETLRQPEYTVAAFILLNVIVFVETGLLLGFFLPGDSLLVTAGLVAAKCDWNLALLLGTLSLSAIVGDSIGYSIGFKTGPKIFCREKSLLFNKDHLLKAQAFYERHGGKTIFLARFMPIVRTFAPVVAGVGRMHYRSFVFYNVFGGVGWVCSMVLCGYFLPTFLNPLLRPIFGEGFAIEEHVEKVVIVVVLVSIAPGGVMWLKSKLKNRHVESAADATENASTANLVG